MTTVCLPSSSPTADDLEFVCRLCGDTRFDDFCLPSAPAKPTGLLACRSCRLLHVPPPAAPATLDPRPPEEAQT